MNERARWSLFWLWFAVSVVGPGGVFDAAAAEIYSYTDDQGNFVASDSLENVPEGIAAAPRSARSRTAGRLRQLPPRRRRVSRRSCSRWLNGSRKP